MAKTLTVKRIAALRAPGRYRDGLTRGLYLQISRSGTRSWLLRYERGGKEHFHGLGPLDVVSLREARQRAARVRLGLLDGIDPIEKRKAERAARALETAKPTMTFEQAAQSWLAKHEQEWKHPKSAREFRSGFRAHVYPVIGKVPVDAVDTTLVLKVIEPLWTTRTVKAARLLRQIAGILDWATVAGFRHGDNPARWRGYLDQLLPKPSKIAKTNHHPALPYAEVPSFLEALWEREGTAARALEFVVLTAVRHGEMLGATWDEINLEDRVWIIPGERMKGGKDHCVPLSDRAVELLRTLPREDGNPYVFIGAQPRKPLTAMALPAMLKRMGRTDITTHGMRSTFRTWAAERTAFPDHVAELCLAHTVGGAVERSYKRTTLLEKRRKLMQLWAAYCYSTPTSAAVVSIQGRRKAG